MAILQVALFVASALTGLEAMTGPGIGTYRTEDGTLVHCRRGSDGTARVDFEDGDRALSTFDLVKLSDDPGWPDFSRADEYSSQLFD